MEKKLYERVLRKKLRFSTKRGLLCTEDLWDLSLEELDAVAVSLNAATEKEEISFIGKKTSSVREEDTKAMFDVVKRIIDVKLEEKEANRLALNRRAQKQRILELIANKRDASLAEKGEEELLAMLAELDS